MVIAEAPGAKEDEAGKPFQGAAGKRLDKVFEEVGIRREDVFITNLLKCRPPDNRNPFPSEIEKCSGYLWKQIELIKPYIIVTMGKYSSNFLLQIKEPMGKMRGSIYQICVDGYEPFVIPIYHPAATLYDRKKWDTFKEDWNLVKNMLV